MKETLSSSQSVDRLLSDDNANWTYNGAKALVAYLENYEEETGEEIELDVVAIRCEYDEYNSARDAYKQQTGDDVDEETAIEHLKEKTTVIEFESGIIIQAY